MNKKIYVYIDVENNPILVGKFLPLVRNNQEHATFEYDKTWIDNPNHFPLSAAFLIGATSFYAPAGKALFGAIGDSSPDRWGRVLMTQAENFHAEKQNKKPKKLMEIDYLLRVDDETRLGALRFSHKENGPFLAINPEIYIPSFIDLPKLLQASEHINSGNESEEDLTLLVPAGSSLGGARPKSSVIDEDGSLAIAKFPQKIDEINIVLWEAVALTLAKKAHISVPKWRIEYIKGNPVLISQRFDRDKKNRIPFLSAMSMLGADENEPRSYLEIVDKLRQQGAKSVDDIKELWRRIVFSIFIANTDDHLRNHAFLYEEKNGWRLAPAYDLNPIPMDVKPRVLSTTIDFSDATGSIELAMSVSHYFGLTPDMAEKIVSEVESAVLGWKSEAKKLNISAAEIERMSSAFMEN